MSRQFGYPLAVQQAALRQAVDDGNPHLAFEGGSAWDHLTYYIAQADKQQPGPDKPLATAAQAVADEAARFGTPKSLRALLATSPDALAQNTPPAMLYAGLVWFVLRLKSSAASMLSYQQSLLEAGVAASDRREVLHALGPMVEEARASIAPLLQGLNKWKDGVLPANAALAQLATQTGTDLQAQQEALGRLQAAIASIEEQLAHLGLFSGHKKKELEAQLHALREQLARDTALSEQLRLQLEGVNLLLANGGWLEAAIDELIHWLDGLRTAWSALGSGTTQLAADASDAELGNDSWLAQTLASAMAFPLWQALITAAQHYASNALVDFPAPPDAAGRQP